MGAIQSSINSMLGSMTQAIGLKKIIQGQKSGAEATNKLVEKIDKAEADQVKAQTTYATQADLKDASAETKQEFDILKRGQLKSMEERLKALEKMKNERAGKNAQTDEVNKLYEMLSNPESAEDYLYPTGGNK